MGFRSVLAALEELYGAAFVETLLNGLPTTQADLYRYRIVNTGWYSAADYRQLWNAIVEHKGLAAARVIGAACMRRDVSGVYRLLFKVVSVETMIHQSGKLFSNYYDPGTMTTVDVRKGHARTVCEGCFGFNRPMWEEIAGSSEELIRLGGGGSPSARIVRGGGDHPYCEMDIDWI